METEIRDFNSPHVVIYEIDGERYSEALVLEVLRHAIAQGKQTK